MNKVTTCIWFESQAEEAAKLYVSLFPNSGIVTVTHYTDAGPAPKGTVLTVTFELDGVEYTLLNGGPSFPLSEAVSLVAKCRDQAEVDRLWEALLEGGRPSQCGWLKDRFGLSWQVVPEKMFELIEDGAPQKTAAMMQAMFKMQKLDMAELQQAYDAG